MIVHKYSYMYLVAFILGFLIVAQGNAVIDVASDSVERDETLGYQEIRIYKDKNEDLEEGIGELESTLAQLSDQNLALEGIEDQIEKYRKLSGDIAVFGPGLEIRVDANLNSPWLIDIVNEFFHAGAEAVSVNGIRITNESLGFDTLPRGQVLLNGSILSPPFDFKLIGESEVIHSILEGPGGIFDRLESSFPQAKISVTKKEVIQID